MLSKVALNNQNRICMETLNAAPTVQLLTKQNPRKRRTLLPESLNCISIPYTHIHERSFFWLGKGTSIKRGGIKKKWKISQRWTKAISRRRTELGCSGRMSSSCLAYAKSEKWAFMYMRVRDAYFISVSMIVLFDFGIVLTCGIVLTVWDCSDSVILFWQCGIVLTGLYFFYCPFGILWRVFTVWGKMHAMLT
jgi:hypothetical protein